MWSALFVVAGALVRCCVFLMFSVVFCGAVLGLVARRCPLVACFGVGAPVWRRGLLFCGWCGLLWCPAPLCWCFAVVWCCAVVLCCLFAVLFVLVLSFALSRGAVLPCGAVLLGCAVCCPLL